MVGCDLGRLGRHCGNRRRFLYSWLESKTSTAQIVARAAMTIDKSLKVRAGMISNRNVLTRAEKIAKLEEQDRWKDGDPVLGLPKVRVEKLSLKKKKKSKKEEEEEKK